MRQAGEPTVEEILDSIKKVIARDNRAMAEGRPVGQEPDRREAPAFSAAEESQAKDEDVFDLIEAEELDDAPDHGEEADGPLLASPAIDSMRESLAALAVMAEPGAPPQIVRSGETSLESLARELLRPALAEWLDKNLPPLVERMVAQEIARIVGKRG